MATTWEDGARNAIADGIDDHVNTGTGTAALKLETDADAEVAAFALANPAFGAASSGAIAASGTPIDDEDAAGGTVDHGSLYNRNGDKVCEGDAATSGAAITVSSTTIAAGEKVTLTSLTITVPASDA